MNKILILLILLATAGSVLLHGCGDEPEPKMQIAGSNASSKVQQALTNPLDPRYEATLAEGIDFRKPGYPNMLIDVSGMSAYEPWGRWTDGENGAVAKFRFNQPLPRKFTLELEATAFGPNVGQPIKVRAGNNEKDFVVKDPQVLETYRLTFEETSGADTIEILPSKPISPKEIDPQNGDTRKLGVGLISLKIRD